MKDAATVVLFICAVAALPILVRALVGTLPRTPADSLRAAMPWSPRDTAARLRHGAVTARAVAAALHRRRRRRRRRSRRLAAIGDQDAALTAAAIVAAARLLLLGARAARRHADTLADRLDRARRRTRRRRLALRAIVEHGGVDAQFEATREILTAWAATTDVGEIRAAPAERAAEVIAAALARPAHAVEPGLLEQLHAAKAPQTGRRADDQRSEPRHARLPPSLRGEAREPRRRRL